MSVSSNESNMRVQAKAKAKAKAKATTFKAKATTFEAKAEASDQGLTSLSTSKMLRSWNPGHRTLKVIWTDTDRSATYDFLLTCHNNQGPISYRFRDKRRFQSKIEKFFHPVYFAPCWRVSLEVGGIGAGCPKTGYRAEKEVGRMDDIFSRVDTVH